MKWRGDGGHDAGHSVGRTARVVAEVFDPVRVNGGHEGVSAPDAVQTADSVVLDHLAERRGHSELAASRVDGHHTGQSASLLRA